MVPTTLVGGYFDSRKLVLVFNLQKKEKDEYCTNLIFSVLVRVTMAFSGEWDRCDLIFCNQDT